MKKKKSINQEKKRENGSNIQERQTKQIIIKGGIKKGKRLREKKMRKNEEKKIGKEGDAERQTKKKNKGIKNQDRERERNNIKKRD